MLNKPDYKTNDPKGWCGDPNRGAALGRSNIKGQYDGQPMILQKIGLDSGGYDKLGTYWGFGDPLYWVASQDGKIEVTFRAGNRKEAKEIVRKEYPGARFYR